MRIIVLPVIALLSACTAMTTATGETGIAMGDSYERVLAKLQADHNITKTIEGQGIRAEGYSVMLKSCRTKYFVFQGDNGLQQVTYEPAAHLSVENQCQ